MNKKQLILLFFIFNLTSCNSGGSSEGSQTPNQPMKIAVSQNNSGVCSNVNSPCVSLTICDTNNNNCSIVNNVLLDTGSYGLRIFNTVLNQNTLNNLSSITSGGNPVGECVSYGDGSQNWGNIVAANVQLSSDALASNVPIQIINSNFLTPPSACNNATTSPTDFGYNGVLGVGMYTKDGGNYYVCSGNNCNTTINLPSSSQVTNPISMLPSNNNGLTISFNQIGSNGASNVNGTVNFGVNTNSQNTIQASNVYPADLSQGIPFFNSNYNGNSYLSFLDSGTNTLAISNSGITQCSNPYTGFLCPSNSLNLTFNNYNSQGASIPSNINIANTISLINSGNSAYNNLGSILSFSGANLMDFGLPFFYGKNIQIVFNNSTSNLGNGPFWAW